MSRQFEEAFRPLLRKSLKTFERERLLSFLIASPSEFDNWEETTAVVDLVTRYEALHASIPQTTETIEDRVKAWVKSTLGTAMLRYKKLQDLSLEGLGAGPGYVPPRRPSLRRITNEVLAWAKATSIQHVTTSRLRGVIAGFDRQVKADEDVVLKRCKDRGLWAAVADIVGVCMEMTEYLSRSEQPARELPQSFLSCLQLVINKRVELGPILIRASIPLFEGQTWPGVSPLERAEYGALNAHKLSATDVVRARRLVQAFGKLQESGFDLALDLYTSHLRRHDERERAVDIAIALENLYLSLSGGGGELRYRFSIHVATFSRRLPPTERVSRSTAEALYRARSDVVHGNKPLAKNIELLNSAGARLVRATLISIASKQNRAFLQNISSEVERLVGA